MALSTSKLESFATRVDSKLHNVNSVWYEKFKSFRPKFDVNAFGNEVETNAFKIDFKSKTGVIFTM